jgi:hypothetical protein
VQDIARTVGRLALAGTLVVLLLPDPVRADSAEPAYFDFNKLKERYEQEERQRQQEGYVLQELNGNQGKKGGRLTIGGTSDVEDPYQQFGAKTNFRGSTSDEINPPGLSLRLSF